MNWTNIFIYLGIFIGTALIWYLIVFYVLDWLGLW
jgi:hypothetical protein